MRQSVTARITITTLIMTAGTSIPTAGNEALRVAEEYTRFDNSGLITTALAPGHTLSDSLCGC